MLLPARNKQQRLLREIWTLPEVSAWESNCFKNILACAASMTSCTLSLMPLNEPDALTTWLLKHDNSKFLIIYTQIIIPTKSAANQTAAQAPFLYVSLQSKMTNLTLACGTSSNLARQATTRENDGKVFWHVFRTWISRTAMLHGQGLHLERCWWEQMSK